MEFVGTLLLLTSKLGKKTTVLLRHGCIIHLELFLKNLSLSGVS